MNKRVAVALILLIVFFINIVGGTISVAVNNVQNTNIPDAINGEESLTKTDIDDEEESLTETDIDDEEESLTETDIDDEEESLTETDLDDEENSLTETDLDDEENSLAEIDENNEKESSTENGVDDENEGSEDNNTKINILSTNILDNSNNEIKVTYQGHGEGYGWQSWVSNGQLAGTDGQSKRLEGIKIKLENVPEGAKIIYRAHGQDYGWQDWVSEGELAGTVGESRRIEAIEIKLVNMDEYSVEYRVQGQDYGWQSWVSDGELAGTTGESKRVEGIQIRIVKKDEKAISLKYQGQGEGYGWQSWVRDGQLAGTDGQSKRLEGISIKLENAPSDAKIIYQAHGEGYGWQNYVSNGQYAGTVGESKRMEAIRIQLVNLDGYSVQYRAQVEGYGWLPWVADGELAGTVGESRRLEGLQVKIVPKIKHSKVVIENPTRTIITTSDLTISGYALSEYENTKLKLYIDSNLVTAERIERNDVFSINTTTSTTIKVNYGNSSTNPMPGYTAQVDLSEYGTGKHTITAKLYDSTGNTLLASTSKDFAYYTDREYGIDVSKYQGKINWSQVKQSNVDFAMIRAGFRGYGQAGNIAQDVSFKDNIEGALKNGIKCGVYFFSQAINREEGIEEAKWILEQVKEYDITYPIAIDTELVDAASDARANNISVEDRTEAVKGFVETIKNEGYTPIIYANKYWLTSKLDMTKLDGYEVWLAHYNVPGAPDNTSDYTGYYTMWQYTSEGTISGISGNVDLNISYKKYGE